MDFTADIKSLSTVEADTPKAMDDNSSEAKDGTSVGQTDIINLASVLNSGTF